MIELSFNSKKPTVVEPRFLIIYSKPKVGKTSNLLQLPNSLLIDLENSSDLYEGNAINVQKIAQANGVSPIKVLKEISVKIEKANAEAKKAVYDYITLDSATVLEEYAVRLATANYKQTVIGKNFTGTNVVTELPQGAGYNFLREAFEQLYEPFWKLAGKCFILVVHTKDTLLNKEGKDVVTSELNLTGKSKMITASRADGIGLLYRSKEKPNVNVISFKGNDQDLSVGCRLPHLRNKEIELSSLDEGDELIVNWDLIFPSLKQ